MEISEVRNRLHQAIVRAKRNASERRARTDAASRTFETFLNRIAIPLIRQVSNVLRADGYLYSVSTPSGSVRMMSDSSAEDFLELLLDTSVDPPRVVGHVSRSRGRRVLEVERIIGSGDPEGITEEELLTFLLK